MTDRKVERRLAAIMAADVAGYTRLMEADTDGTVAAWKAARESVILPAVTNHAGKIVKLTGDGFLAEFPAIQEAVTCAITMQRQLADSPLDFRIGVNLGDIVDDGQDIHGEGVNIAARIEALAEPGSVCVTGMVFEAIRNRVDASFDDLGEHQLKNVSAPVRIWQWTGEARQSVAEIARAPVDTPELPDIPSIAVLPFDTMSSDPEQEYFADGMAEDLITDLSKVSGLFVVARNSSFTYKGKAVDIRQAARELGVRYVLEGSVRKAGNRVRINAQLIDAGSGGHLWAERYDGTVDDVFELQDEVGAQVVSALSVQLSRSESENLKRVHTSNLDAYELFVRARATPFPPVPERIKSACQMFETVIEMDPEFAGGYAGVALMLSFGAIWSHRDVSEVVERAIALAQKAVAVDPAFGSGHTALGLALLHRHRYEEAIAAGREATVQQPNDADAHAFLGFLQGIVGHYADGIDSVNLALRLNPQFIHGPYLNIRGQTEGLAGRLDAAVATFTENVARGGPIGPPALCWAAAAHVGLGQTDKAGELVARLRRDFPDFTTANWNYPPLIRDEAVRQRVIDRMLAAGIPG